METHERTFLNQSKDLAVEDALDVLIGGCDGLARIFQSVYDRRFTVCVKALVDRDSVRVVARNRENIENAKANNTNLHSDKPAKTKDNTDFEKVLGVDVPVFACDDLPNLPLYKNSTPD